MYCKSIIKCTVYIQIGDLSLFQMSINIEKTKNRSPFYDIIKDEHVNYFPLDHIIAPGDPVKAKNTNSTEQETEHFIS